MRRRELLIGALTGAVLPPFELRAYVMAAQPTPEEIKRRNIEYRELSIRNFPFERVEVAGDQALATWEKLRTAGRGVPIIFGDDDSFANLAEPFHPNAKRGKTVGEILEIAGRLRHPADLFTMRESENASSREQIRQLFENQPNMPLPTVNGREMTREEFMAMAARERLLPEVGEWPGNESHVTELAIGIGALTGRSGQKVYIGLIPTDDWTTVPAHLRWGGWNECPHAEYHVAALRSWRDRYGANLLGLGSDQMILTVEIRPQSRAEALELAREYHIYCSDIVNQGLGTLSHLAATLMDNDWWFFWWD